MLRRKLRAEEARGVGPKDDADESDICFALDADAAFRQSYQGRALRESILASTTTATATSGITKHAEVVTKHSRKFLGIIDKRYVRTFPGLMHAIASIVSLVIGNYLFLRVIVLNHNSMLDSTETTVFHVATFLSGATLLPFWAKVQSWQLSTTTIAQKGLSGAQMQRFNQGRGVLAPLLSAIYPLIRRYRGDLLDDATAARWIGASVGLVALYQYTLIRDYGKALFVVYGGSKLGFSLHLLLLAGSNNNTENALEYLEKESLLVACCVEFGFLWYYLYSRRLVTKEFVQIMCRNYHPALLYVWMLRLTADRWWTKLPWASMFWVMVLNSLLTVLFLVKMVQSLVAAGRRHQAPSKHTL
mmetsp:Transcript_8210/g.19410  ORF Transcript_8210/g.19410 Transcript_8210/m.19410 type:complete len:359 (-) Transcript_8210:259-1335(-)|eukprot:CAMPEP_0185809086 /NCGR_PEP_ID=MMETSP1322-20130828/5995_1 /TAXON_ID=265543 /ORGANISM="Minutocellus polymorphus, Strain RCC2270" /LENGTH=358 /DNA_ID=CAMNT_0028505335 /DNA_START=208 /DNA_END=1284 /DNA_ORIENTATION=+